MPRRKGRRPPYKVIHLDDLGVRGINLHAQDDTLSQQELRAHEHGRNTRRSLERRKGAVRLNAFDENTDTEGSWSCATVADYFLVAPAAHLQIPVGGFGYSMHVTAVRPTTGTVTLFGGRVTGKAYGPFHLQLGSTGLFRAAFRKEADESEVSVTASTAITAGGDAHLFAHCDPNAGTWTLRINGSINGTVATGLASTVKPMQDNPSLSFGAEYNAAAIVAGTGFFGNMDAFTLYSFAGLDLTTTSGNGMSFIDTMTKWSLQEWPAPQAPMVLAHYGFDEASGVATIYDYSRFKNHAPKFGTPAKAARVARTVAHGHAVGVVQQPSGVIFKRINFAGAQGQHFIETVRQ